MDAVSYYSIGSVVILIVYTTLMGQLYHESKQVHVKLKKQVLSKIMIKKRENGLNCTASLLDHWGVTLVT